MACLSMILKIMSILLLLNLAAIAGSWSQKETFSQILGNEIAFTNNFSAHINYSEANNTQEIHNQYAYLEGINCTIEDNPHKKPAQNVHKLRPEDLDFIAALGDSTVAGTGANSNGSSKIWLDYRGLSFASGGDGNLSQITTLPNIIRLYNPDVTGYSVGIGPVGVDSSAHLNMAEARAQTGDISVQARKLLWRIGILPENKLKWKLITISVGSEDLCKFCFGQPSDHPFDWISEIRKTLDYLKSNQKNVLINLVGLRNIKEFYNLTNSPATFRTRCPCLDHERYDEVFKDFNQALQRVAKTYDRLDFSVVYQPMWTDVKNESDDNAKNGTCADVFSSDCFGLSAKGQASSASALWNNMIEPVGRKNNKFSTNDIRLNCPTTECPYFRTNVNSVNCNISEQDLRFIVGIKQEKSAENLESTMQTYFLVMAGLTTLLILLGLLTAKLMDAHRPHRRTRVITERTCLLNGGNQPTV